MKLTFVEDNIFSSQLQAGESPLFNLGGYFTICGDFTFEYIKQSLESVVEKNSVFYVKLNPLPGERKPVKTIEDSPLCRIYELDYSNMDEIDNRVKKLFSDELKKSIPIFSDVYFSFYIVKISESKYSVGVKSHHIFIDGISLQIAMNSVILALKKDKEETDNHLEDYCSIFEEEVGRQTSYLSSKLYRIDKEYWNSYFQSVMLRSVEPELVQREFGAQRIKYQMSKDESAALRALSNSFGMSLQDLIIGFLTISLYRIHSKGEIKFGVFLHNRTRPTVKRAIGLFSSILPCVIELNKEMCPSDVVGTISNTVKANYRHRRYPIAHLNKDIIEEYQRGFDYDFVVGIEQFQGLTDSEGNEIEFEALYSDIIEFPLIARYKIFEGNRNEEFDILFDENVVSRAELDALIEFFKRLTSAGKFDLPIGSPAMLPLSLESVNFDQEISTAVSEALIHRQFEEIVARSPNKTAVICGGQSVSYMELEERSNRIANYLISNGVNIETVVGVSCTRSIDGLVAIIGILKSGASYLPLDPAYPYERLCYMIEDSQAAWVIAHKCSMLGQLENVASSTLILDDENDLRRLNTFSSDRPQITNDETNLAYLIYTSGSTGKPKGVMVEHKNVINFLRSMAVSPGLDKNDVLLSVTSLSFDIQVLEMFLPLCVGATVVIAESDEFYSASALSRLIDVYDVSIMQGTPATWRLLLDHDWWPSSKIRALCGGEKLEEATRQKFQKRPNIELWNMYGPTETTVWSLVERVGNSVNIGNPIANTACVVLNANYQQVPNGVHGELFIGGEGVARGYWRRPELTERKFINYKIFGQQYRFYATGDLVTKGFDGKYSYLGRKDFQIKIGGIRVEVGEIEHEILSMSGVRSAIVIQRQNPDRRKILVAFIQRYSQEIQCDELAVKKHLACKIPNHLIPEDVIFLDEFPMTPNKKVDRLVLANMNITFSSDPKVQSTITDPSEKLISEIWAKVLNISVENIYRESNLLELGGDSLAIMTIWIKCNSSGICFRMEKLFSGASLSEIAASVSTREDPDISENDSIADPCKPLVDQIGVLSEEYGDSPFCINTIFDLNKDISKTRLKKVCDELVRKHTSLHLRFCQEKEGWLCYSDQFATNEGVLDFQTIEGFWSDSKENALEIFGQMYKYLNVFAGSHLVVRVVTDKNNESKIFISASHLVCDQYSMELLFSDFVSLYEKDRADPVPYGDDNYQFVANRIHERVNSEGYYSQIEYWESLPWDKLERLPIDYPESNCKQKNIALTSCIHCEMLSSEETDLMLRICSDHLEISVVNFLVASLTAYFSEVNESECQHVFVYDHGRAFFEDQDVSEIMSGLVGFFATFKSYFLKINYSGVDKLLYKDIESQISEIPHSGLGFQQLRNNCNDLDVLERMQALPGPDVWLNYVGFRYSNGSELNDLITPSALMQRAEYVHIHPDFPRARLFLLPWDIMDGQLRMFWEYSGAVHKNRTVDMLAKGFKNYILKAIQTFS